MKTISLSVSKEDYDAYRIESRLQNRPIAQLIREAMAFYRQEKLEVRQPLTDLPVLAGHRAQTPLPSRAEIYDQIFTDEENEA
jgi:hypothetical protein